MEGGGSERQLAYLARSLVTLGWEVHVALFRRGPNWDRLESSGAVVHELTAVSGYDPRLYAQVARVVAAVDPHVIQTWLFSMQVAGGLAAAALQTPWVFSERSSAPAYQSSTGDLVRIAVARTADAIVSNSAAGDAYWADRIGTDVRRYVIPNGLPLDEIGAESPASMDTITVSDDTPLILFAGRFAPEKNLDLLLPALGHVFAQRMGRAVLCGDGPLRQGFADWIMARGLGDRIAIRGYTTNLWALMKRATVVASPSLFEGAPNVVLEAMACGTPLIVSDIEAHRRLLDDSSAVFVSPDSVDALTSAILTVLNDGDAAQARARVARGLADRYALPAIARRYAEVYHDVIDRRPASVG